MNSKYLPCYLIETNSLLAGRDNKMSNTSFLVDDNNVNNVLVIWLSLQGNPGLLKVDVHHQCTGTGLELVRRRQTWLVELDICFPPPAEHQKIWNSFSWTFCLENTRSQWNIMKFLSLKYQILTCMMSLRTRPLYQELIVFFPVFTDLIKMFAAGSGEKYASVSLQGIQCWEIFLCYLKNECNFPGDLKLG